MTPSFPGPASPGAHPCRSATRLPGGAPLAAGRALAAITLALAGLASAAGCRDEPPRREPCHRCKVTIPDFSRKPAPAPPPEGKQCVRSCARASDCAAPSAQPLWDAGHFACVSGRCEYTGCKSDGECTSTFGTGFVCEAGPGGQARTCTPVCSTPADCAEPEAQPLYDASHFACVSNRCEYTGCKSDAECGAVLGDGAACEPVPGTSYRDCAVTCDTPADCTYPDAQSLQDASHFACIEHRCHYLGCKSSAECTAAYGRGWLCL